MQQALTILFSLCLLLLKFSLPIAKAQSGTWLWGRGETAAITEGYAVATDRWGNVYGAGFVTLTSSSAVFGSITVPNTATAPNFSQPIWVKYSSNGTALWADGTQNGDAYLYNITTDTSGDLIVFGLFDSPTIQIGGTTLTNAYSSSGGSQYFVAKYNPTGTLLWAICDGYVSNTTNADVVFPGSYYPVVILTTGGITTDATGNIYITSCFQKPSITIGSYTLTNADTSGLTNDVFIAKYNSAGVLAWAKRIGGNSDDLVFGITVGSVGNIYIAGPFWSSSVTVGPSIITDPFGIGGYSTGGYSTGGVPLAYIAEFSPTGVPLWAQAAGGSNGAYGMGLATDSSGNVYMTGGFGDVSISFGSTTITRTYPAAVPYLALYLVQYSPDNIVTWSKTIGSDSANVYGYSIGLAACGAVWVSGNYYQDANVDGHILPLVAGSDPIFIAGYDLAGGVIGYSGLGSGGDDQNGIAVDPNGNVFICSDFEGDSYTTFSIGPDTLSGGWDEYLYIGKYANVVGTSGVNYISQNIPVCSGRISAPVGFTSYYWDNASTSSTNNITLPGTYWVTCTDAGSCVPTIVDTFHVTLDTLPALFSLGSDTTLCQGETCVLTSGNSAAIWNTGDTGASIIVTQPGLYYASVGNVCGIISDSIRVGFGICDIWVPTAFTPNNDGLNDIIHVCGQLKTYRNFSFNIYNRWGQRVFHTEDINAGWDGKFNGVSQNMDTYFYEIFYDLNGSRHVMKGDFQLIK